MAVGVAAGAALAFSACRGATEIVVDVRAHVPCADRAAWKGVAIYTGAPGLDVETKAPVLISTACDDSGHVGSIALVPSGTKDALVSVRVVAGLTRPPDQCAEHGYQGCIVARRTLSFIAHQSLAVDVDLTGDCVGQGCDALHTCLQGSCQDSRVTVAPPPDGGAPSGPTVRCGDSELRCPTTGAICCLTVTDGGTTGACLPPEQCPPKSITLQCDDESDCTSGLDDAGRGPLCCVSYTVAAGDNTYNANAVQLTQCLPYATCTDGKFNGTLGMCQHRSACLGGTSICEQASAALPGYFYCKIPPPK